MMRRRDGAAQKIIAGLADVVFATIRVIELKGLLDRAEVAALLKGAREDVVAQEGGVNGRVFAIDTLIAALELPEPGIEARSRLRIVDGPEPPCGDGA
jgi:hypothetical protein